MGLRVGDCTRGSAEKCVRLQLCFLVPTLDCQVLEINCIIFLDKRAAPSNVGWMPSLLIKPGFPQKGCQLSMKPTWFAGHHLDSQRWKDAMRLYMTSLVTLDTVDLCNCYTPTLCIRFFILFYLIIYHILQSPLSRASSLHFFYEGEFP